MLDLEPATRVLTDLLAGVRDDQLGAPTPCSEASLGDLIDHVDGLSVAFIAAARKTLLPVGGQRWDIAVASGQRFTSQPHLLEAAYGFVHSTVAQNPQGTPGLVGPPVPVAEDSPLVDRLVGLTGRDPAWAERSLAGVMRASRDTP